MTSTGKILIGTTVVLLAVNIYQATRISDLNGRLQRQHDEQQSFVDKLRNERDEALKLSASAQKEIARQRRETAEIPKLRGELTSLRKDAQDAPATDPSTKSWIARISLLKQKLEQMPERKIPEFAFLTDKDWGTAAWDADLDSEYGVREALSKLRESAVNTFLNEMMKDAFKKYLAANGGVLPADLLQLKPYFDKPVTDEMLQRYKLLQTGKPDNSADLVTLTSHADELFDSNHGMSINGAWGGGFNHVRERIEGAVNAFVSANNGQQPTDPSQLTPYLGNETDAAALQKYFAKAVADNASHPIPPEIGAALETLGPAFEAYAAANNRKAPDKPSELKPYLTTPEQKAAFEKIYANHR